MTSVKILCIAAMAAAGGVFVYQNTTVMQLTFLFWSVTMSASLMVCAAFFAGVLAGFMLLFLGSRKKGLKTKARLTGKAVTAQ